VRHPVLTTLIRTRVRQDLRRQGTGLVEAIHLANLVDADVIDTARDQLPPEGVSALDATIAPTAVGDGSFIDRILKFLDSELGKTLLALIRSLIGV
jgi:hypothetical protein